MRARRLRIWGPWRSRIPSVTPVPPGAQPRSGNPQFLGNLAQRPAAARQQPHRLPLEFIRELTTRGTHQTPSCPIRSLSEVSIISREGQFAENGLALRIEGFQLIFEPPRLDELVVPSALQFTRNETIVRIHGIVLPP